VEVLLVIPHREEREQLGIARDLELADLEEVMDGLALDVGEVQERIDFLLGKPDLLRGFPIEILELDLVRNGKMLSDV
jgi:hypothetical protein